MNSKLLEVGDSIKISRFGYQHVGIYVGPRGSDGRCVVHNSKGNGVVLSHLHEFSKGAPVSISQKIAGNNVQREHVAQRALVLVGKKYDLLTFNCEHAASLIQNGKPESPQLAAFTAFILLIGGLAFLSRKSS